MAGMESFNFGIEDNDAFGVGVTDAIAAELGWNSENGGMVYTDAEGRIFSGSAAFVRMCIDTGVVAQIGFVL